MEVFQEIKVQVTRDAGALSSRVVEALRERIQQRCPARVRQVEDEAQIVLEIRAGLAAEAFQIAQDGEVLRIAAGQERGLWYGVGKFLRTSRYQDGENGEQAFTASSWRGISTPRGSLRGMYFASHFHNWYQEAPEEEIRRYVEDLALWGVNAISTCFPFIDLHGWDDPEAEAAVAMLRRYARITRQAGLMFGLMLNNTFFSGVPTALRAAPLPDPTGRRGNSGNPVCPSRPQGHAYILDNTRQLFERIFPGACKSRDIPHDLRALQHINEQATGEGLDFIVHWPYDEGGCACADCQPWGSRGFLQLSRDVTRLGKEYFPHLKTVLSTWMFDTPPEGEWQGLSGALAEGNDWVDGILADSHEDYPRYPLEVGVPGGLPLYTFPEISMWGNWPWGGMGANPLPGRFQNLWDQVSAVARGGLPYSEGIYEDLNKAVVTQFYWDPRQSARATLEEYTGYEFSPEAAPRALELIELLEGAASRWYQKQPVDPRAAERAERLAGEIDAGLPGWARRSWRWEVLRLRARLDYERFDGGGLESPPAEAAMLRLAELYHCQLETHDPYHHRVRPPLRQARSTQGEF